MGPTRRREFGGVMGPPGRRRRVKRSNCGFVFLSCDRLGARLSRIGLLLGRFVALLASLGTLLGVSWAVLGWSGQGEKRRCRNGGAGDVEEIRWAKV
eukprot:9496341-Pyramimonas_sp.AAC.1